MQGLVYAYMFRLNCLSACSACQACHESLSLNNFIYGLKSLYCAGLLWMEYFLITAEVQVEQQEISQEPRNIHLLSFESKKTLWGSSLWRISSSPETTIGFGRVTCHLAGSTRVQELPGLPLPGNKTDPSFKGVSWERSHGFWEL